MLFLKCSVKLAARLEVKLKLPHFFLCTFVYICVLFSPYTPILKITSGQFFIVYVCLSISSLYPHPFTLKITNWLTAVQPDINLMAASESHFAHLEIYARKKFGGVPDRERYLSAAAT